MDLEDRLEAAHRDLKTARAVEHEAQFSALRKAAEAIWKAAAYGGERAASEWQAEVAWAILHDEETPALDTGLV
jgi:hypothetical protein